MVRRTYYVPLTVLSHTIEVLMQRRADGVRHIKQSGGPLQ
jgi:hypothetical protein